MGPLKNIQYVRSSGSTAKLISKNKFTHTALVKLPSGVRKIFSIYTIAILGGSYFKQKKNLSNTKSGFWRTQGLRPCVRGVAMNPVDHPHGGRTKSIKYPRTPWGLPTKLKKKY